MTFQSMGQMAIFAFMALVTSAVFGLLIVEIAKGAHGLVEIAVYGGTASFGIEFLVASWRSLWGEPQRTS
jgi:hypothetical protein